MSSLASSHNPAIPGPDLPSCLARADPAGDQSQPASHWPGQHASGLDWTAYQDRSGFSVKLPPGWARSSATRTGTYPGVDFTGPSAGFDLFISWSRITGPSALGAWQQLDALHAENDPTYHRINLQQVHYRGYDAAVREFTDIHDGVLTHVIDWGFVVKPGVEGYAIELYGPEADWSDVYDSIWNEILTSFMPADS